MGKKNKSKTKRKQQNLSAAPVKSDSIEEDIVTGSAVSIVYYDHYNNELHYDDLSEILGFDDLKDHHVVAVSIAGALRKGKSFLLNFFLKYLYAKYKKHDTQDWMGKRLENGFEWRGGKKPETMGILMWSEIFTHVQPNGDKLAIILLDTQGLFDDESSLKHCIATFAISTMISSITCFNVMNTIKEDDLQYFGLFTEFARLFKQQTNKKPFQNLNFIIRDWPYTHEDEYGYSQKFVKKLLNNYSNQTDDMHQLRDRIWSSFNKINAFLMPEPGDAVCRGNNFNGNLDKIEPEFLKYVKILTTSLFAPENLLAKQINGQKMQPMEWMEYFEECAGIFINKEYPDPKTILMATASIFYDKLRDECLNSYGELMEGFLNERSRVNVNKPFYDDFDFDYYHHIASREAISMFQNKRKIGDEEQINSHLYELKHFIKYAFISFDNENKQRRLNFHAKTEKDLRDLSFDCLKHYNSLMEEAFQRVITYYQDRELLDINKKAYDSAVLMARNKKIIGDANRVKSAKTKIQSDLETAFSPFLRKNEQYRTMAMAKAKENLHDLHIDCLSAYVSSMENQIPTPRQSQIFMGIERDALRQEYISEDQLQMMHSRAHAAAVSMFQNKPNKTDDDNLFSEFISQSKVDLEEAIKKKFAIYKRKNNDAWIDNAINDYAPIAAAGASLFLPFLLRR